MSKLQSTKELIKKSYHKWAVEYHYHIPLPILKQHISKFFHESSNIAKYSSRFLNPNDMEEYHAWLKIQKYEEHFPIPDITFVGRREQFDCFGLPYICMNELDVSKIDSEYIGIVGDSVSFYPEMKQYLGACTGYDLCYFDHDTEHCDPVCKPDFSYDTLRSFNYIGTFFIVKRERIAQFSSGWNPYLWLLHLSDQTMQVGHVEKILYSEEKFHSEKETLRQYFKEKNVNVEIRQSKDLVACDVKYLLDGQPLVSIMIPTKDRSDLLRVCITSILKSSYSNYEIIIGDNNSEKQETFDYFSELEKNHDNIHICKIKGPFNFSAINNEMRRQSHGSYLLMLNNDTEVVTTDWLERMVGYCQNKGVGSVGAQLFYENDKIQHAGVIIGKGGSAAHRYYRCEKDVQDYLYTLQASNNVSSNTAACLMVKASVWDEVEGLNESLSVQYNDVDFSLRMLEKGYRHVFLPSVQLYHYESISRGLDQDKAGAERSIQEIHYFQETWKKYIQHDPNYNDNFDKNYDYQLIVGSGSN